VSTPRGDNSLVRLRRRWSQMRMGIESDPTNEEMRSASPKQGGMFSKAGMICSGQARQEGTTRDGREKASVHQVD